MEEIFAIIQRLQEQMAAQEAKIAALEKENQELRARVKVAPPAAPLKVYSKVEDIVWERGPHNGNTGFLQAWFGSKVDTRPWLNVIVEGIGRVYRMNVAKMPDWYAIAHHRVLDVTANPWVAVVQEGDDSFESDPADMSALVRNYSGGLRYALSTWDQHALGQSLKADFLETHDDPGIVDDRREIPVAPTPTPFR